MRLEYFTDTDFKLFINNIFISNINYDSKDELMVFLKDLMVKVKKMYDINIAGVYEVDIWVLKGVGIELSFKKKDSYSFSNKVVDLKMIIHLEPAVYLKFDNYSYVDRYDNVKFNDKSFYLNVDLLNERDILLLSDFYNVVHDDKIDNYKYVKN